MIQALLIIGSLAGMGTIYVTRTMVRGFFDVADACIAISLHWLEECAVSVPSSLGPRQGGASWPEPPKPLIPVPEMPIPQDANYMPKGSERSEPGTVRPKPDRLLPSLTWTDGVG